MITEATPALRTVCRQDLQARYEKLRQNHMDGVGGFAMSVFIREGMSGWIMAWVHRIPEIDVNKNAMRKTPSQMKTNNDISKDQDEFVAMIATIALTKLKGG